jgi:ribosome maturation factor RimP
MELFAQRLQGIDRSHLEGTLLPILRAHGVRTAEVSYQMESSGWVLRVTVESLEDGTEVGGAIHLQLLAEISRDLSAALDVADFIPQHYHLEVSSPGLDRPLRSARDFRLAVGKTAKLHLAQPAPDGQSVLRGRILDVSADSLRIEVDGRERDIRLGDIGRAHLVFELSAQPKGKRAKSSQHPTPTRAPKASGSI